MINRARLNKFFVRFFCLYFIACVTSSCSDLCGLDWRGGGVGRCRVQKFSFKSTILSGFASCAGVVNSRSIQVSCSANSGSNNTCTARSNQSGYFVVVVPNNSNGAFVDTNYSIVQGNGAIQDCNTLWQALNAPNSGRPSDIVAIYHADPTLGDWLTCNASGCSGTSANCFSGWDPVNEVPSGIAASVANGTYLACAFIDSPWTDGTSPQGVPPTPGLPAGLVANSIAGLFGSITFSSPSATPVLLNNWVDYQ